MKKIICLLVLLVFLVGCADNGEIPKIPEPQKPEEPEIPAMSLEEYYKEYCFGYRVKDTTDLKVLGHGYLEIGPEKEITGYLTGLRNGKLWVGLFNHFTTKEQQSEWLDNEKLELKHSINLGFGDYKDFEVSRIDLTQYIDDNGHTIMRLYMMDPQVTESTNFNLLLFQSRETVQRYYCRINYDEKLMPWYDGSYILRTNLTEDYVYDYGDETYNVFSPSGDILFTKKTYYGIPFNDSEAIVLPISLENFAVARISHVWYENEKRFRNGVTLEYRKLNDSSIIDDIAKYSFPILITEKAQLSASIVDKQDSGFIIRFEITELTGDKHTHNFFINTKNGEYGEVVG